LLLNDIWKEYENTSTKLVVIWQDFVINNYNLLVSLIALRTQGADLYLHQWVADEYKKSKESFNKA